MAVKRPFFDTDPMPSTATKIGRVIRDNREQRGLSQEALAALADLNRSYLGEIERGEVMPSLQTLQMIADALGEPLSQLILQYEHLRDV